MPTVTKRPHSTCHTTFFCQPTAATPSFKSSYIYLQHPHYQTHAHHHNTLKVCNLSRWNTGRMRRDLPSYPLKVYNSQYRIDFLAYTSSHHPPQSSCIRLRESNYIALRSGHSSPQGWRASLCTHALPTSQHAILTIRQRPPQPVKSFSRPYHPLIVQIRQRPSQPVKP